MRAALAATSLLSITAAALVIERPAEAAAPAAPHRIGSGAWSYFGDPRAVHAGGKTFVGWAGKRGYTNIAALRRSRVVDHVRLGPRLRADDHNNPSIHVRSDGRLMVFYSAHNGRHMYIRTARRRHSISSFSRARVLGTNTGGRYGYTYPNPLRVDRRLWLLFRGGNWQPNFSIRTRGRWARARTLVRGPIARDKRDDRPLGRGGRHRPYAKYHSDGRRVHAAFTEGNIGAYPNSIYYAQFDRSGIRTASGRRVARLGSAPPVGRLERVRAFEDRRQWALDVAVGRDRRPVILYQRRAARAEIWWARFNGRTWENHLVTRYARPAKRPGAVGGAILDHEDPSTVYVSRTTGSSPRHDIEVWTTDDAGARWHNKAITTTPEVDDLRPVSPRGLHRHEQVIWFAGRRTSWTSFDTDVFSHIPRVAWPPRARSF